MENSISDILEQKYGMTLMMTQRNLNHHNLTKNKFEKYLLLKYNEWNPFSFNIGIVFVKYIYCNLHNSLMSNLYLTAWAFSHYPILIIAS